MPHLQVNTPKHQKSSLLPPNNKHPRLPQTALFRGVLDGVGVGLTLDDFLFVLGVLALGGRQVQGRWQVVASEKRPPKQRTRSSSGACAQGDV